MDLSAPTTALSDQAQLQSLRPALASSLLDVEIERDASSARSGSWLSGVNSVDSTILQDVLSSFKVIALAVHHGCSSLAEHIIAAHLLSSSQDSEADDRPTAAFLVTPHHGKVVSILHQTLESKISYLSRIGTLSKRVDALQLLDRVQVLQYFDFAGLFESVSEVSTRLLESRTNAITSVSTSGNVIVYVDGLSWAIESIQRRSGPVQANALLTSFLRSLTHLSRSRSSMLTLLSVDLRKEGRISDDVYTSFSNPTGEGLQLAPGGATGRTLEAAMDVILLVHDGHGTAKKGQMVVEVIKDRLGGYLGAWAVWTVEQKKT